jgi:hypothetical protein
MFLSVRHSPFTVLVIDRYLPGVKLNARWRPISWEFNEREISVARAQRF